MLDINPEHLPIISAQLGITQASLAAVIGTSASRSAPVPCAIDPVSTSVGEMMLSFAQDFYPQTANGSARLAEGSEVLVPVSASYMAGDTTGGVDVGCAGAVLNA
ncbi:hypothetical protein [Nocardia sp. NPDC050710]|uniref:hypothetical protein n=1 Tax=Nocardia sp. NPDC050710 TaxID=3157220 RepID=UPI0033C241DD